MRKVRIVLVIVLSILICVCSQEMHEYTQNEEKNLLLMFLNDKIPVKDYYEIGKEAYYSEIVNEEVAIDEANFYIVDMDGDGDDEFCYFAHSMLDIIKYNQDAECFELWLSVKSQQRPIGNGEMYAVATSQPIIYEYFIYNENAELVESIYYRTGEEYNKELENVTIIYEIDGKIVTEEEWFAKTKIFFEQKENAPGAIPYQELFN